MADGAKRPGPRTLCAEAALKVLAEYSERADIDVDLADPVLARKISDAVIAVALDHITLRMNFPQVSRAPEQTSKEEEED